MQKSNKSSYFLKILWLVGFILLAIISVHYENQIQQTARETFNYIPAMWFKLVISIIFGLYVSLILIKRCTLNINLSLLWCVAIPSIILSFTFPILVTLWSVDYLPEMIASSSVSSWFQKIYSTNVFGMVAGLTVILSLFNAPNK